MKRIKKGLVCMLAAIIVVTSVNVNAIEPNNDTPSSVIIPNQSTEQVIENFNETEQEENTTIQENSETTDITNNSENSINTEISVEENSYENTDEESQSQANDTYSQVNTLAEPEDAGDAVVDNWSISTVFYDSTVDKGHTPLTEIDWNAVSKDDERIITVQINYKNTSAATNYNAGELNIKIPILTAFLDGKRAEPYPYNKDFPSPSISAGTLEQGYDWNYEIIDKNIVFTNNINIEKFSNFEGSIQISYELMPGKVINNSHKTISAVLSNNSEEIVTSNDITFNFTSNRSSHKLIKTAYPLSSADGLPNADNYIWTRWEISHEATWDGVRMAAQRSIVFEEIVPDGALVYDKRMTLLENMDGKVRFYGNNYYSGEETKIEATIYIAYPKDRYEGQKITNTINSYGVYWDETEESFLATDTKEINLTDYSFSYTGNLYGITKKSDSKMSSWWVRNSSASAYCKIKPLAVYTGGQMDIVIGDDVLFAPNNSNVYEHLTDDEYFFTGISYYGTQMTNLNGSSIKDYDMDFYVRYKNTSEYVKYGDTLKANRDFNNSDLPEGIVGWKLIIHDMEESLAPKKDYNFTTTVSICKKDIADTGYLYNFVYIQAYKDGVLQNEPTIDSYDTNATKLDIATYDKATYGTYMQRACSSSKIIFNQLGLIPEKEKTNFTDYPSEEKFKNEWTLSTRMDLEHGSTDNFKGMSYYDLLPSGMQIESTEKEIIENIILDKKDYDTYFINAEKKSGEKFKNGEEFLKYWKDHCTVTIKPNWRNTGRTWLKIEFNFSEDPLSFAKMSDKISSMTPIEIKFSTSVSYDSYLEYGNKYVNYVYVTIEDREGYELYDSIHLYYDAGEAEEDAADINENGIMEEYVYINYNIASINSVVATHQDVQKQVRTDKNDFTADKAISSYNSEYTYKLRVRTGQNDVTNLVIYDSIEKYIKDKDGNITEAYGTKDHWNGEFLGVDTSYAESKGYTVKTWYSEQENAGNLYNADGSLNSNYKEYIVSLEPNYSKSVTITSPNWPNNYPSGMTESSNSWEESFSGAAKVQVVFDSTSKTEDSFDCISVYDETGKNKYRLSGTEFAGNTYIVDGDYVKLTMISDTSRQYKGFSATITPLYEKTTFDKTKIKSLAFEYLDADGNKAILPANSLTYVLVKMKSPADETIKTFAYNGCYTEWNAIDKYGNVVDFITGINSNIVKVGLLNSIDDEALPVINVNFTKDIVGEDKAFNYIKLDKDALYSFTITMKEKETGNVYNGVVNNKNVLTFTGVPYGTYEIEESNDHYFNFVDMIENNGDAIFPEGITLSKDKDKYVLTISDTVKEDLSYNIKVTNKIEDTRLYEEKNEIFNVFAAIKEAVS